VTVFTHLPCREYCSNRMLAAVPELRPYNFKSSLSSVPLLSSPATHTEART
jgi:hypothetical protein